MDVITNAIDALVDITPLYMEGFLLTLALLGHLPASGRLFLGFLSRRCVSRRFLRCASSQPSTPSCSATSRCFSSCSSAPSCCPFSASTSTTSSSQLLGLTLYTSPFVAEAVRSGFNGVPVGQAEAARSIGMGFTQTVGLVILPQASRMVVPPLINVFIALTKNTSVAGSVLRQRTLQSNRRRVA